RYMVRTLTSKCCARSSARTVPRACISSRMAISRSVRFIDRYARYTIPGPRFRRACDELATLRLSPPPGAAAPPRRSATPGGGPPLTACSLPLPARASFSAKRNHSLKTRRHGNRHSDALKRHVNRQVDVTILLLSLGRISEGGEPCVTRAQEAGVGGTSGAIGVSDGPPVFFAVGRPGRVGDVPQGHDADPRAPVLLSVVEGLEDVGGFLVFTDREPRVVGVHR